MEDPKNRRSGIRISVIGKVMEQLILQTMFKHREEKKVVWSHQHRFTTVEFEGLRLAA